MRIRVSDNVYGTSVSIKTETIIRPCITIKPLALGSHI